MPQTRGHNLRTVNGIDNEHGHLCRLHSCKRISEKIRLTRGIKQIDLVILIRNGRN